MLKYISLFLFLLNVFVSASQETEYKFRHLSIKDGLSYSSVNVCFQDKNGFMWLGTDLGLNKYDGKDFTVYTHNGFDSTSISANYVVDVFEDSFSEFWVATGYNGLNKFDRAKEEFKYYLHNPVVDGSISSDNIRAVFEDSRRNLWVATAGGGVNLYNRKFDLFEQLPYDSLGKKGLISNFINSIDEDSKGNLWFGSSEGILIKYSPFENNFEHYILYENYAGVKYDKSYCKVFVDSDDNVWFGTENGLCFFDSQIKSIEHYNSRSDKFKLNVNAISSVFEFKKNVFWVSTDHGGINVINKKTGEINYILSKKNDNKSLSNNQLHSIYQSPDGIVWIGSYKGGVNYFNPMPKKFKKLNDVLTNNYKNCCSPVQAIAEDPNENIWIGYDGQGGDVYEVESKRIIPLHKYIGVSEASLPRIIFRIYKDKNNDLWLGSFMQGLYKIDWKSGRVVRFLHNSADKNSISGNNIRGIFEDSKGNFWVSTIGAGLNLFDRKSGKFKSYVHDPDNKNTISNNTINSIEEGVDGVLWLATRKGITRFNPENDSFYRIVSKPEDKNDFAESKIHDIIPREDGKFWIGSDLGLSLFDPEKESFSQYLDEFFMNRTSVHAIQLDEHNNLWLSTNLGLKQYNYLTNELIEYSINDGLLGLELNPGTFISSDGTFYIGGTNGLNFFKPKDIKKDTVVAPIYITNFKVFHESISHKNSDQILSKHINFAEEIIIEHHQSIISFEFAALDYLNAGHLKYAYMLEGFNHDWNDIGNRKEVSFTNLDPGEYIFHVKACNKDRVWGKAASIKLIVLPPFYKTLWFRILMAFLFAAIIIIYVKYREQSLKKQKRELEKKIDERTIKIKDINVELVKQNIEVINVNQKLNNQTNELSDTIKQLKSTQSQLIHAEKMASLGILTAGIAHEINNPINFVYVGIQKLEQSFTLIKEVIIEYEKLLRLNLEKEALRKLDKLKKLKYFEEHYKMVPALIESVKTGALRTEEIVKGLMNFSRFNEDDLEYIDIHEGIDSSILLLSNKLKGRIKVIKRYSTKKLYLSCYAGQINQVIMNILSNAIDAIESKGEIVVSTQLIDKIHEEFSILDENCIKISIKDSGQGIDETIREKIFLPFYTTKEVGKGTGLGLSISYGIVEKHKGKILVHSNVGEGAEFQIFLPIKK